MATIKPAAGDLWHTFARAHRLLVSKLDSTLQEMHGLPLSRFEALAHLHTAGSLRMHEFAERLVLSRSATTRFVDRLEQEGLVTRTLCADDRRGMELKLTEEGRHRLRQALPTHRRLVERYLIDSLGSQMATTVAGALSTIAQEVGD
ncbi:MAG TPA: MarR family transcriptional regulator [Acidimicrobiia bacterium]|nr:MarR family transcriptional regulator [Acidimicrobiia bacterium]